MCMRKECNKKYFVFRTLCGKGVDPRNDYSTNLRLDQDTVKIFKADQRLENVQKNVWSEVGEVKEKSLDLGSNNFLKDLSQILSQICPVVLKESWTAPNDQKVQIVT